MKAKEYIAKYKDSEELDVNKLFMEFNDETLQILKDRGVKRNSAVVSVLKEQNIKWNVIVKAFPDILARDGFKKFWLKRMPELHEFWEIKHEPG